ncbi:hypothetical protein [Salinispora arenicola]|uniref:hypothetical protein n=1 Tax=Salinispora arenicola TaxID=168697 RepID=UPI000375BE47|nr:hypothetical protein [Salinispora arenicola]
MSSATLTTTAGILLITVVTIAFGGLALLRHLIGRKAGYLENPVRRGLWTAGHAHAGVLVFALVALPYIDHADAGDGTRTLIRLLFVSAPILMPLGFFLSVVRPQDTKPNKLIWLTVAGGASLAAGSLLLGVNLL